MPRTGQTISYRDGDDGDLQMGVPWPEPRFTDHDDGTVTDNLTGLMWTRNANISNGALNWYDAIDFCNNLDYGGYTDWHLPNMSELFSLIDISKYDTALPDGHPFVNITSTVTDHYWSSTTCSYNIDNAWRIRINSGLFWIESKTNTLYTLAVRGTSNGVIQVHRTGQTQSYLEGDDGCHQMGAPWPEPRFIDSDNETVMDNLTGLMWAKNANLSEGRLNWSDAVDFCNDLDHGGYSDWRLPNIREMQSLMDYSNSNPAIPSGHPFLELAISSPYYSSSTDAYADSVGWFVLMFSGRMNAHLKVTNSFVWPVRCGY